MWFHADLNNCFVQGVISDAHLEEPLISVATVIAGQVKHKNNKTVEQPYQQIHYLRSMQDVERKNGCGCIGPTAAPGFIGLNMFHANLSVSEFSGLESLRRTDVSWNRYLVRER